MSKRAGPLARFGALSALLTAFVLCVSPTSARAQGGGGPVPNKGQECFEQFLENLKTCREAFCNTFGCREPAFSTCVEGARLVLEYCLEN